MKKLVAFLLIIAMCLTLISVVWATGELDSSETPVEKDTDISTELEEFSVTNSDGQDDAEVTTIVVSSDDTPEVLEAELLDVEATQAPFVDNASDESTSDISDDEAAEDITVSEGDTPASDGSPTSPAKYDYPLPGGTSKRLASITYNGAKDVSFSYDSNGRIRTLTRYDNKGKVYETDTYTYDSAGRLLTREFYSPVYNPSRRTYSYSYDSQGRLIHEVKPYDGGEAPGTEWWYTYDADGYLTACKVKYDPGNTQTTWSITHRYDGNGNLIYDATYIYDGTEYTNTVLEYDAQGRIIVDHDVTRDISYYRGTPCFNICDTKYYYDIYSGENTDLRFYDAAGNVLYTYVYMGNKDTLTFDHDGFLLFGTHPKNNGADVYRFDYENELGPVGSCGDNLSWQLNSTTGLLTISGTGNMCTSSDERMNPPVWYNSSIVKKVIIEEGATNVGASMFFWCNGLTTISLPSSVTSIDDYAFGWCSALQSIEIPGNVKTIAESAFYISGLEYVVIPTSVTDIGWNAFGSNYNLTDVYYGGSEAQWEKIEIEENNEPLLNATIHYNSNGPEPSPLDVCLSKPSVDPDNDLAIIAANMCNKAYTIDNILGYLTYDLGFDEENIYWENYDGMGSLAYVIAVKDYEGSDADGNTGVMVIIARGSTNPYELFNDKFTGTDWSYHEYPVYTIVKDFNNAILEGLEDVLDNAGYDYYKVLLTGHSLGGASANLLGARITDMPGNTKDDIFCYTFGAIDSIVSDGTVYYGYENIHNITNFHDSFGPDGWPTFFNAKGSTRYGKFGHIDLFDLELDQSFGSFRSHDMSTYVYAVENNLVDYENSANQKIVGIHCPVDIEIYSGGSLVGRVKDNVVDQDVTTIPICVVNDEKYILTQNDQEYDIRILASDTGTMSYSLTDSETGREEKVFSNVLLTPEKTMASTVSGHINSEDVRLVTVDETGAPVTMIQTDGTETAFGNVDGNETVDALDAALILRHVVGMTNAAAGYTPKDAAAVLYKASKNILIETPDPLSGIDVTPNPTATPTPGSGPIIPVTAPPSPTPIPIPTPGDPASATDA